MGNVCASCDSDSMSSPPRTAATLAVPSAATTLLLLSLFGADARAQTAECVPACAEGDRCLDGKCYTRPAAPPPEAVPPQPPIAATPPADVQPVEAPPVQPVTAPPVHHRARHRSAETSDGETDADDELGLPPRRLGLLAMPFIGIHTVQGIASEDYDVGGRGGLLLGVRLNPKVSLNVEAAVDVLNVQSGDRTTSVKGHDLTLAFSPLFHAGGRAAQLVVGPKLGFWSDNFTVTSGSNVARASQSGWAYGLNVGAFTAVNEYVEVGLLISYQFIAAVQACTHGPASTDRMCTTTSDAFPPEILGLTGAALF